MLSFILGGAGTGKSTSCIQKIKECLDAGEQRIYLIVPEQFSFESDRAVYEQLGISAYNSVKVISFTRIAEEIFSTYGGVAGEYADDATKLVLMHLAITEIKDMLSLYAKQAHSTSFATSMVQTIGELKTAGLSPAAFEEKLVQMDGSLLEKSTDISLIYATYNALLERGYKDILDDIVKAGNLAQERRFFSDATVFIDEFKSFTGDEMPLLKAMISQAKQVYVALCTDNTGVTALSLFSAVNQTYQRLCRMASESGVQNEKLCTLTEQHRFHEPVLAHISSAIFRPKAAAYIGDTDAMQIVEATDFYNEVDYVCAKISHLVTENGYTYSDIAVVGRELTSYTTILEGSFEKYNIPYFMDMREPVLHKSLLLMVLSAFEAVQGYQTEAILRYAKTGLLNLSVSHISKLENYCFLWDIKSKLWLQDFYAPTDENSDTALDALNTTRRTLIEPLRSFRDATENATGDAITEALYALLVQCGVPDTVGKLCSAYYDAGQVALSHELRQLWDILMNALDTLHKNLDGIGIARTRYAELLRLVLSATSFASPPQTLDAVTVGSADRMRMAAPKAVFVIGANEGILPYMPKTSGLYSDKEREVLLSCGIELPQNNVERLAEERFIAYKALSSPSERLILSYSLSDSGGKALLSSTMVKQLLDMLSNDVMVYAGKLSPLFYCTTLQSTYQQLAQGYREDTPERASLVAVLGEREDIRPKLDYLSKAAAMGGHMLHDREAARQLFGDNMVISATKFESYQKCKFLYFCMSGLKIYPQRRMELNPIERGNVIHYCLYGVLSKTDFADFLSFDKQRLQELTQELLQEYLQAELGGDFAKTKRFEYLYQRLTRAILEIFLQLQKEFSQSEFVPCDFELEIDKGGEVEPIELKTAAGTRILVKGKIDRVDMLEKNGQRYIRVVDYKSGTRVFQLADVFYGLNMQMLLYLFAIWQNGKGKYQDIFPAGVLYMPSKESTVALDRDAEDAEIEAERLAQYRMNGLLIDDPVALQGMEQEGQGIFIPVRPDEAGKYKSKPNIIALEQLGKLKRHAEQLLVTMAESLHRGRIEAVPSVGMSYDPCSYCDYSSVCGNSSNADKRKIRPLYKLDKVELFERLKEDDDNA